MNFDNIILDTSQQRVLKAFAYYARLLNKRVKIFNILKRRTSKSGIYLWGGVGTGKSMLLNHFYESLRDTRKIKYHFHDFMQHFHNQLYTSNNRSLVEMSHEFARKYKILFLDELQINNIADAMIVGPLFRILLDKNVLVFLTSNRHPNDLFKDGLQRERFEPFIELICHRLEVIELNHNIDYRRLIQHQQNETFDTTIDLHYLTKEEVVNRRSFYPLGVVADEFVKYKMHLLANGHKWSYDTLHIDKNRELIIYSCNNIAFFTFQEICDASRGAVDYLAIARKFHTVIIHNIPVLDADHHNQALRLITFIDCLYQEDCIVIYTAEDSIDRIYKSGRNRFEFDRTISRLIEKK